VIWTNTFDGGTNGAGLTVANSGGASGNAFAAVESTIVFANTRAQSGSLSAKLSSGANSSYGRLANTDRNVAARFYVWFDAAHSIDYTMWQPRVTTSAATSLYNVMVNQDSHFRLRTGPTGTVLWDSTATVPLGQWVRVEVLHKQGVAADDGQLRIAYYLGDSTTPVEMSPWFTGLNLRGAEGVAGQIYLGKTSGDAYASNAYMDTVAIKTGTDYADWIGPNVIPNTAPVANAGADLFVTAGSTVTLAGTASDPDGNALTYSWAFAWPSSGAPALTNGSTLSPSFTAGALGSIYAVRLTVNDGTTTTTDTVNVAVVPSSSSDPTELMWTGTAWV
jgi:hypothetical protein